MVDAFAGEEDFVAEFGDDGRCLVRLHFVLRRVAWMGNLGEGGSGV